MNKFIFPILAVFVLLAYSCSTKSKEELIVGKWQFENFDMNSLIEKSGGRVSEYEMSQLKAAEGMMKLIQYEFFQDKTYTYGSENFPTTVKRGTYTIENDGTYLVLNQEPSENSRRRSDGINRYEIITLTSDSLVMNMEDVLVVYSHVKENK